MKHIAIFLLGALTLGHENAAFILLPNAPRILVVSDKVSGAYGTPARAGLRWADL